VGTGRTRQPLLRIFRPMMTVIPNSLQGQQECEWTATDRFIDDPSQPRHARFSSHFLSRIDQYLPESESMIEGQPNEMSNRAGAQILPWFPVLSKLIDFEPSKKGYERDVGFSPYPKLIAPRDFHVFARFGTSSVSRWRPPSHPQRAWGFHAAAH